MGLGKSRLVDETVQCLQKRLRQNVPDTPVPIAITLNTRAFGSLSKPTPSTETTIVSRMLMTYFALEPSPITLLNIQSICKRITLSEATAMILGDYNTFCNTTTNRIVLFVDELAKVSPKYAQDMIDIIVNELDQNAGFAFVGTALEWNPVIDHQVTNSGRDINFFPTQPLSESASKRLIDWATENSYSPTDVAFAAAALGGHPRLLQLFRTTFQGLSRNSSTPTMEDLLENTAANISDVYMLSPEEIKLSLLNSLVTRTAIIKDKALRRAIATGKILATFSGPARKQISLSVPALIMRSSVANATPDKKLSFADVTRLEKVAAVSGWMSLRKFAVHNMDKGGQGKAFKAYHLHAEAAQWGLRLGSTNQLGDFYTNANFYSGEALKQVFKYTQPGIIVRLPALGRELFPAKAFDAHFCDAFEADTVFAALDEMCKTRSSLVPEFKFQEAYDYMYGVRLKGGRNLVVVVDTTFALDNNLKTPEELQRRLRKKVEACQKLNWAHLGLKYKRDVVQVLICYSELPADWDWELEVKNLDVSNLIVMDRSACRAFYGGLYGFTPFLYEAHNIV